MGPSKYFSLSLRQEGKKKKKKEETKKERKMQFNNNANCLYIEIIKVSIFNY